MDKLICLWLFNFEFGSTERFDCARRRLTEVLILMHLQKVGNFSSPLKREDQGENEDTIISCPYLLLPPVPSPPGEIGLRKRKL